MTRSALFCLLAALALSACMPEEKPAPPPAPEASAQPAKQPVQAKPAKPAVKPPETACQVKLTEPREKLAEQYYIKGERLVNNDEIKAAKQALETALCLDPKHKQANDLLNLLKRTYP
jgi:hypothetical protein